jgi:Helix-turn-helix domain
MDEKKKATPEKEVALKQIRDQFIGTSGRNQAERLLAALARFPVTTFEAMRLLDVYHVPARVLQLRKAGHQIMTHWQIVTTEAGATHRVGLYVLQRGADHA